MIQSAIILCVCACACVHAWSRTIVVSCKTSKAYWLGHVVRHDDLSNVILQGTVEGEWRRRRRQRKSGNNCRVDAVSGFHSSPRCWFQRAATDFGCWCFQDDTHVTRDPELRDGMIRAEIRCDEMSWYPAWCCIWTTSKIVWDTLRYDYVNKFGY